MDIVFQLEDIDNFQNVAQEILSSLYCSNKTKTTLEQGVLDSAKQDLKTILSDCDFKKENVITLLNNKGWDQKMINGFMKLMEEQWSNIVTAAFSHYNSAYGETVVNTDWLAKLVFGTSELKTLRYPLLQLIMTTKDKNGHQNIISYDVKKDMLLKMINVLENISQ